MQKTQTQKRIEQTSRIHLLTLTVSASCPKRSWKQPFVSVNTEPTQIENWASLMPRPALMFVYVSSLPPDTRYAGTVITIREVEIAYGKSAIGRRCG